MTSAVQKRTVFEAEGVEKRIFGLELKIISSKKGKPILTDKSPEAKRQLGREDDDLGTDELLMVDIEQEQWDEILNDGDEV
ncbi:uncharacterized protein HMPREF1541_08948 [Cyphellophora europaea CBS 101466]|uniref:Uncharacterized protein n=1 Tax=Cyphellophora europaea (strain CBS 101466) TaxID=1220924 RepID=W2RJZ8_CYPE1|nr:uncharacterized protein HMPREF1541_08948 [Cyphellophora europaea CBS 101466]ETN36670.1 hypothetical protein HMPREF1541_08948 [Cyphellophora europaea CBS 101466]